jgi:hypothetical protein
MGLWISSPHGCPGTISRSRGGGWRIGSCARCERCARAHNRTAAPTLRRDDLPHCRAHNAAERRPARPYVCGTPISAAHRLAVVVLTAAITVAAMIAVSSATSSPRTQLYRHFCLVMPDQVAAAGPYFAR